MCYVCHLFFIVKSNPSQICFVTVSFLKNYIDCWLDLHIHAEVQEFWHSHTQSHHISYRILPNPKPHLLNLCSITSRGLRNTKFVIQTGNKYISNAFCNSVTAGLTLMIHALGLWELLLSPNLALKGYIPSSNIDWNRAVTCCKFCRQLKGWT